jgi:hypothetical protein
MSTDFAYRVMKVLTTIHIGLVLLAIGYIVWLFN